MGGKRARIQARACRGRVLLLAAALAGGLASGASARQAPGDTISASPPTDTVATTIESLGFNSIIDGQPNSPGQLEILQGASWRRSATDGNPWRATTSINYTLPGPHFLNNAMVGVVIPVQFNGPGHGLGNVGLFWQQRWLARQAPIRSLATYLQADFPTQQGVSGITLFLVGTYAQRLGPGVFYLQGSAQTGGADGARLLSGLGGYKWIVQSRFAIEVDLLYRAIRSQPDESRLEFSPFYIFNPNLALGIGTFWALGNRSSTPSYAFGVLATIVF